MNNILTLIFMWITKPYILICIFVYIIYTFLTANYNFWSKLGIPFKKPTIIFGNFSDLLLFRKSQCDGIREMYNWFKNERYFGVFRVRSPILIVRDPDLIKYICVNDFHYFVNRGIMIKNHGILERHLFNLQDEEWRNLRLKLTPVFSTFKIKRMLYLLIECSNALESSINEIVLKNSTVDVRDLISKFSIDVIGSCAFGIHTNALCDKYSPFHMIVEKMSRPNYKNTLWRMLRNSLPQIYNLLKIQLIDPEITLFFQNIVSQLIKQRECEHERENKRNDFMDLLIQLKNEKITMNNDDVVNKNMFDENDKKSSTDMAFDENMIAAQAFAFFVASHQPLSNTISFCLYELALNPEIQTKTREDIYKAINKNRGNLTYETLHDMTYLETVILETLRKYPPAPITSRRSEYPYKIPGTDIILPAGIRVVIPIYAIHHDPNYYPDPDKFNPDRFTDYNNKTRHPYTFLSFGKGPRNCIGMKFAMMQAKMAIISFLNQHEITVCEKTVVPIKFNRFSIVTSSEDRIWLKFNSI